VAVRTANLALVDLGFDTRPTATAPRVVRYVAQFLGDVVELEPMNAFDRRVVHHALKDDPGVETHSVEVEGTTKKAILLRPKR